MSEIRAFIAFDISKTMNNKISVLSEQLKKTIPNGQWTVPERMHVTLKFLGNISLEGVYEISKVLTDALDEFSPFSFHFSQFGGFPNNNKARVLWLGCHDEEGILDSIGNKLNSAFLQFRIGAEQRKYHPHLTLARFKKHYCNLTSLHDIISASSIPDGKQTVNKVHMYQSERSKGKLQYIRLSTVNL